MNNQDWATPWHLFMRLDNEFHFTIDAAASKINTKCTRFIDESTDSLHMALFDEVIFCNPPYAHMEPWVRKFIEWSERNMVVCLVQDKTDTDWFRDLFNSAQQVRFLHGRVPFIGARPGNMYGAAVFVLGPWKEERKVDIWDWKVEPWK